MGSWRATKRPLRDRTKQKAPVRCGAVAAVALGALILALSSTGSGQVSLEPAPAPPVAIRHPDPGVLQSPETTSQTPSEAGGVAEQAAPLTVVGGTWTAQGPRPIINGQVENVSPNNAVDGAIKAVAANPANANVIYVGTVNGGIWKTINGSVANPTWTPQTDRQNSLSIGALKFDPTNSTNNTLIAGVGRYSSDAGIGGARIGLLRTINGGSTWTALNGGGMLTGKNVAGVAARGARILAAVDIADSFTFSNIGIFRSVNTGASFVQISGRAGSGLPLGSTYDLAGDPASPATLYTAVVFAGLADGVYKSIDTGATWKKVSDATVDSFFNDNPPQRDAQRQNRRRQRP